MEETAPAVGQSRGSSRLQPGRGRMSDDPSRLHRVRPQVQRRLDVPRVRRRRRAAAAGTPTRTPAR
uniref:Uncharacterized protein n=1 Tax=uncultured marine virus TaxID=186617 RepID=A0A0F7LAE7_9VIRU|nr:hypothetical protein [uncultured marine virus]